MSRWCSNQLSYAPEIQQLSIAAEKPSLGNRFFTDQTKHREIASEVPRAPLRRRALDAKAVRHNCEKGVLRFGVRLADFLTPQIRSLP